MSNHAEETVDASVYQRFVEDYSGYRKGDFRSDLSYACLGLGGESGEVLEKVKKLFRNRGVEQRSDLTAKDREMLVKELGDVVWYVTAICNEIGAELDDVFVMNMQKLADRKKRGVLHSEGDER